MKLAASLLILVAASLQMASAEDVNISTDKGAPVQHGLSSGIARFGSHTQAQISESGAVTLTQGLTLISSESGFFRHSAVRVSTPQGEIVVRGTAIIAVLADGSIKITCLEGQVKQNLGGAKQTLEPGMISVRSLDGKSALSQVELTPLMQSCALLGTDLPKLPRAESLTRIAANQAKSLDKAPAGNAMLIASAPAPDQSNASGASNIVALNNVIEASSNLSASSASTGSFVYYGNQNSSIGGSLSMGVTVSGINSSLPRPW